MQEVKNTVSWSGEIGRNPVHNGGVNFGKEYWYKEIAGENAEYMRIKICGLMNGRLGASECFILSVKYIEKKECPRCGQVGQWEESFS